MHRPLAIRAAMPRRPSTWNHNIHYHPLVLRALPKNAVRVLDLGCGQGLLTRKLAQRCRDVVGLDLDRDALTAARNAGTQNITYVEADVMTYRFPDESFDMIAGIAVLHHLPLDAALARLRALLKPGGVLCIIGLYRFGSVLDYVTAAAAVPASLAIRGFRGQADVGAPTSDPAETLDEIRERVRVALPGSRLRRHLFFRYSLVWTKPPETARDMPALPRVECWTDADACSTLRLWPPNPP
jgi:SAM-dependent methyltransferase